MRVLVYPHELGMGGSQTNAIELAAAVRDLGHEVYVFGRPGALNERIDELDLPFVTSPDVKRRPSPAAVRALRNTVKELSIDIVHGYEWPPALEAELATIGTPAAAMSTVMSMAIAPFIPRSQPLIVGTRQIADHERRRGRLRVDVIEPPVDLMHNQFPADFDRDAVRSAFGLQPGGFTLVTVTRLAQQLKLEGLLTAIRVIGELRSEESVQLLIVGDGPARDEVRQAADRVNDLHGEQVIVLTGELLDPRAAYACADAVLGMGGSALRAMAFDRPVIVQGEQGFFSLLDELSLPLFTWQGWYGIGEGSAHGPQALRAILQTLLHESDLDALGSLSGSVVRSGYSLEGAARRQVELYRSRVGRARSGVGTARLSASARFAGHEVARRVDRVVGRAAADDFNSSPVHGATPILDPRPTLVYLAGTPWDGPSGTDRRLAEAFSNQRDVLWVDPPRSLRHGTAGEIDRDPHPGVRRVAVTGPPGLSRPGLRQVAHGLTARAIKQELRTTGASVEHIVIARPEDRFPPGVPGRRLLHITDDWVAGAELLGLDSRAVGRRLDRLMAEADSVSTVSGELAQILTGRHGRADIAVIPNGCDAAAYSSVTPSTDPVVGLVGQLNERLDLRILAALTDAGFRLTAVGPLTAIDPVVRAELEIFLTRPGVDWLGRRDPAELPAIVSTMAVGITPYLDTPFNRSSSPLKTVEYLAAGLPVVSTPLPATLALGSAVATAGDPESFVVAVRAALEAGSSSADIKARKALAASHDWKHRARQLLDVSER